MLAGQVALIAGASRGIGRAVAGAFLREKSHVTIRRVCESCFGR
jgi:NAD(P)-dependent dehydrogenase (short-subunit alcohol dehydrogenase family)